MEKVDTILVTGVLGSGKTTTINRLISDLDSRGKRLYGLVNDIGALNVDAERIMLPEDRIAGYSSGCVCCERREDLQKSLASLDQTNVDMLLVEPSGAANPIDIVETLIDDERINLKHVVTLIPVRHFDSVRSKSSFLGGLSTASVVGYTWPTDPEERRKVDSFLSDQGVTQQRIVVDENFGYDSLENLVGWSIEGFIGEEHDHHHGHEHYKTVIRTINPAASREEVIAVLERLANHGISRAKGFVPHLHISFDIVGNSLAISDGRGRGSMAYAVLIDEGELPVDLIEPITAPREGAFFADNATPQSRLATFHYYYSRSAGTRPDAGGIVQSNFEAPDEAYIAAKQIALQDRDTNPLRLALAPYIDIRLGGLRALQKSAQQNKNYVGVMLGSFAIQMLGEWDKIPFQSLADSRQLEKIKKEAVPQFFDYLKAFGDKDMEPIRGKDGDPYSCYFVKMARQASQYAKPEDVQTAARNMTGVYRRNGKEEIVNMWRQLT